MNPSEARLLILGGGTLAADLMEKLHGSRITVIAETLDPVLRRLLDADPSIIYVPAAYDQELLPEAGVIYCASSDPAITMQLRHDAEALGLRGDGRQRSRSG